MEDFLNNHCISSKGNPTNDDFRITFKYDFLAPPRESLPRQLRAETSMNKLGSSAADEFLEEGQDGTTHPETEVLWYMAGSKEHRYLLKHPVITSFLSLKWGRISYHYNSNLLFYTLLVGVLTSYIFANYGGQALGVQPPLCPNQTNSSGSPGNSLNSYQSGLWWTLLVLIILLGIREVFQFSISAARYFHSVENIIEVALVLSVGLLLGYGAPGCHVQMKRELSSAALMFSWIELVTMVGRHPILTTYNTYLTMFYRVLKTFLQFLAWYSLFLLAFSLSFYILLHSNQDEASEYIYFDHIGLTIVKICSMFIGELEFSDLPLSSAYSYIFFLIFIFLIVVVLMNLLNGLAVSDTGLIREDAEIHSHVCRVEVISAAEATILGDPAHILTGPGKLFPTCGLRRKLGTMFRTRTVLQRVLGGTGVMLFYSVLPDKQLVIYPNRKSLLCSPCLSSKEVGREIVDSAKNLVLRLSRENQEKQGWEQAIKEIRLKQESMEEKMDRVLVKLENISNSLKL
ncbi:transient receptor potential cation channel protein painless [Eurytemora carolleeae]|uniref:transient receptor potential cation channel protein painless n=1 Tax=Eurytemora carolleeae TaxID=1294199 RepID=UPI000C7572B4|nr:transient receptor potential cation channel protein painless [Eurytemora carolleeae]|eukprot:XP_023321018.1 transient receptor potential cation channel protein painless-like [Eurytemora affinis]